ncbi:hypothetical protein PFISCL1PPCAC_16746, partial [Pristionchus fissidentatus]
AEMNQPDFKPTMIKELTPGIQSVNCFFIVIEKTPAVGFRNTVGDFTTVRVADQTGSINLNFFTNEYADCLHPGDICKLKNGHTTMFRGCMSLQCGKAGELFKMSEFCLAFSETPNMSEYNADWAAQFPAKPRPGFEVPVDDPHATPAIGAPPRINAQPLMNLIPPGMSLPGGAGGGGAPMTRDPRAAKRFHDPRSAAAAAAASRGDQ